MKLSWIIQVRFSNCFINYLFHILSLSDKEEIHKYREHLEELVEERTAELEEKNKELKRFNNLFVNREFRIKELKDKIKELEEKLSSWVVEWTRFVHRSGNEGG